jgi:hypothetical protein
VFAIPRPLLLRNVDIAV